MLTNVSKDWKCAPADFPSLGKGRGTPQLWLFDLDAVTGFDREAWLDAEELAHARRLRAALERQRYVRSHALARHLLAQQLGVAPAAVVIERTRSGKPFVAGCDFAFSRSCSGALFLFGICHGGAVGVDVEQMQDDFDFLPVAEDVFSAAEMAELRAASAPEQRRLFHRLWTRHEARAKATGRGLCAVGPNVETEWSTYENEISIIGHPAALGMVWSC